MNPSMFDLLAGFFGELRAAGLPVSLTETIDATEALWHVPLEDRAALRSALASTLVKNAAHTEAFDTVFEVYFSLRRSAPGQHGETAGRGPEGVVTGGSGGGAMESLTAEELAEMLYRVLRSGDTATTRLFAAEAVTRHAGMQPGRPAGVGYYQFRTLKPFDLDAVLARLAGETTAGDGAPVNALEAHLMRQEYEHRAVLLRQEVEAEIRRRLVADRGAEAVAKTLRTPLPEDVDFIHASAEQLRSMRHVMVPLTRKLALRLARRRLHRRSGPLDFRATVRRSLSSGGVPLDARYRRARPSKPEIVVIADISGSVSSFAAFTLQFVYAISTHFSKVRTFAFVDGIDEVTGHLEASDDLLEVVHRLNSEADVVWVDGHSDYGNSLAVFWERWGQQLTARSSVIVLGDARNNYHVSESWTLDRIRRRAGHLFWLNPEPESYWNTGDSIIGEYGRHCDRVVECRNLRQLERFVEELA
ncbi:VWA domain-containing protein [Streptosporangium sp. NPDC002544]|uniref:vWA domain-containing protein n=1 Tax=Streptosporangium sp. NPDC002544 TaxID=3154538 RepID=UPI00332239D8